MNAMMVEKFDIDSGAEGLKQQLQDRILALRTAIEEQREKLAEYEHMLIAIEGGKPVEVNPNGIYRGVNSGNAILMYLNGAGSFVSEEQMIRELIREGAGLGKAGKRGGAEGVIRKSISTFLKHGMEGDEKPLLVRRGDVTDPKRTIGLGIWTEK